ncbi:MAG: sulfide/dihydroorotate dehydrogenase-like FAD/NAD-binding protein [Oscillospiraceae bacterium]|jgi:ferredoxin--NADP+ reductase|nr:sulfide/dihydroorotate dehydrogenase-like FAD/NAD-binding protein [Oscillospiraceae bacterium]
MYTIIAKELLAPGLVRLDFTAPRIASSALPGQFVIVRALEEGERVPLTIAATDTAAGSVSIIFQTIGVSTRQLGALSAGQRLASATGPLGKPSEFFGAKRVLCVGGGVGTAVLYPQVTALYRMGVPVDVVQGARSRDYLILQNELGALCGQLILMTDDGSAGRKGFVTDALRDLLAAGEAYDLCVAIGPPLMMRAVAEITRPIGLRTVVSLNPIMLDGTGMCGCCRVQVGGQTKYACVDGPDFDGHQVDFDSLIRRLKGFVDEEQALNQQHPCGGLYHGK